MKKNIIFSNFIILACAILGSLPSAAAAATIYLETTKNTINVGDTVIVTAKINAEGATLNTVQGDIAKTGGNILAVQEFSLANSAFGLWPQTPSLSQNGQTVSFVGGVPGGFNIEGATIFKIIFEAKEPGQVTLVPQNMAVFASDGKGTKVPVSVKNLVLNVESSSAGAVPEDEWKALVAADTKAPEDFIVVLGQDATLFDNKKFAFFSALDNQSGIDHYEVSENGGPAVRTGSTYVLQNQEVEPRLTVTAIDKAGNKKLANYPNSSRPISWSTIIAIVALVVLIRWYLKRRRNKQNARIS